MGNVRVSYSDLDKDGSIDKTKNEILEESNYYPFGLKHEPNAVINKQPNYKYKYNGKELQDELGLNLTAMDWRQYDGAIGRFMNIDPLAQMMPSVTPNHFGYNNPVFWADPSGLLSQAFIDSLLKNSHGNSTTWTNDGSGLFSHGQTQHVDENGNYFETTADEHLPTVKLYKGLGDKRNAGIAEGHLYKHGKYYQGFRDKMFSNQLDDTQDFLDGMGTVPLFGEAFDGINGLISLARGNKAQAALSFAAMIPIAGLAATGVKGLKKVDNVAGTAKAVGDGVPNSVYNYTGKDGTLVSKYFTMMQEKSNFKSIFRNMVIGLQVMAIQ